MTRENGNLLTSYSEFAHRNEVNMGGHDYDLHGAKSVTKKQAMRINKVEGKSQVGDWYAKADPDTGAIQWIRQKIKRRKKR